jgi:crossover junction endodeoxyribonuclease RuvC
VTVYIKDTSCLVTFDKIEHMFILGIDPGLTRCGYGLVTSSSESRNSWKVLKAGVLTSSYGDPTHLRLKEIYRQLDEIVRDLTPDAIVVEKVFFKVNVKTAMAVGQSSGIALLVASQNNIPVFQYGATEVKQAIAGYGQATKSQIQTMVAKLCGLDKIPGPPDVADAIGLAITHMIALPYLKSIEKALGTSS